MRLSTGSGLFLFLIFKHRLARPQALPLTRLFHFSRSAMLRQYNPMLRPRPWIFEMLGESSFTGDQEGMYAAIRDDNTLELKRLLDTGPAVHLVKAEGFGGGFGTAEAWGYPLHFAAYIGNLDAVRTLLDAGAEPTTRATMNAEREYDASPLYLAIMNGHRAIVKALWDAGAASDPFLAETTASFSLLKLAAAFGHAAIVRDLLSWKQWDLDVRLSALQEAAGQWRFDVVDELLRPGAYFGDDDLFPTLHEALHVAVDYIPPGPDEFCPESRPPERVEQQMLIDRLIDAGADPNMSVHGCPTLVRAAQYGVLGLEAVRTLLDNGANIDVQDRDGKTAFHHFVERGDSWSSISLLLRHHANPNLSDSLGVTALQLAAKCATDWSDLEPIMETYVGGDSPVETYDSDSSETLLHFAALGGKKETVEKLVSVYDMDINAKTQTGWTPLMFALLPKAWRIFVGSNTLHSAVRTARLLLSHGANPLSTTDEGWTPLHVLSLHLDDCPNGEAQALALELISLGCSINPPPACTLPQPWHAPFPDLRFRQWPTLPLLHWAALHGAVDVVKALVESGANVFEQDINGHTAKEVAENSEFLGTQMSGVGPYRNIGTVGRKIIEVLNAAQWRR